MRKKEKEKQIEGNKKELKEVERWMEMSINYVLEDGQPDKNCKVLFFFCFFALLLATGL